MATPNSAPPRKPRLLWANPFCLLDTSSGASMAVREMLIQLAKNGYEVMVLGATIFDAEKGTFKLRDHWQMIEEKHKQVIKVNDGALIHHLIATKSIVRNQMTAEEEGAWYGLYTSALDQFKPDLVWFYGGQTLDMLIPDEARARGIPSAAYLVNGNYQGTRWCRDVDLIITDSQATADFYKERQGFSPVAVGTFIEPQTVLAEHHERKNLLFINPSLQKGAGIVVQLAMLLEKQRPDITFEVVESRGNWHALVKNITAILDEQRESLSNVIITPNTDDMRPIYGRARLLLAPSLGWESGARVLAEAMINGIPAVVTDRGGSPEMIQDGGLKIKLPDDLHEKPYTRLPKSELLQPLIDRIVQFYDNEELYQQYVERARHVGKTRHALETSTGRLMKAFAPLIKRRMNNETKAVKVDRSHKHGATPPSRTDDDRPYKEICQRFNMFTPNSAGWTGGLRALADLTQQSAHATIDALGRLAQKAGHDAQVSIQDLSQLPLTKAAELLSQQLANLFREHGSDKATVHNYHILYGHILASAHDAPTIFEIGLGSNNVDTPSNMGAKGRPGASLRAFRDCFQQGRVFGADVDRRILFEEERIKTHFIDQTDPATFTVLGDWLPEDLDLMIDDGLHAPGANLNTLLFGLDRIKPGGWIVIEDILPPMLPIWKLVAQLLPSGFEPELIKAKSSLLFVLQRTHP
jgi:glycosyltransferase involved in cell wall biosynthesis